MAIKTIMVQNFGMKREESQAAGTIKPGMLIQENSSGYYVAHATAGGNAEAMFAIEDELRGRNIDQNYTSGDRVQSVICRPGDVVYCRIANGQSITRNDFLESNGDGYMKKHTPDVDSSANTGTIYLKAIVLKALESVDMSDSSGADPTGLCKARVV